LDLEKSERIPASFHPKRWVKLASALGQTVFMLMRHRERKFALVQSSVNTRVLLLRTSKGLTQEELGNLVGVTGQRVSEWERGGIVEDEYKQILTEKLGSTFDELFGSTIAVEQGRDIMEQLEEVTPEYVLVEKRTYGLFFDNVEKVSKSLEIIRDKNKLTGGFMLDSISQMQMSYGYISKV